MSGYVGAGISLGLLLIAAMSLARRETSAVDGVSAGVVTDNTVRLHAKDVGQSCWRGTLRGDVARMAVTVSIGLDGRVARAVASGPQAAPLKGCVEAHVKGWQFLPQQAPSTVVLPFEIDGR